MQSNICTYSQMCFGLQKPEILKKNTKTPSFQNKSLKAGATPLILLLLMGRLNHLSPHCGQGYLLKQLALGVCPRIL